MIFKKYKIIGKNLVYKRVNWPDEVLIRCTMCIINNTDIHTNSKCMVCRKIREKRLELNLNIEQNTYVFTKEI